MNIEREKKEEESTRKQRVTHLHERSQALTQ